MTRFDQLARQVALLPQDRQDVIADVIEDMLAQVANESSVLTDEQQEIVRQRLAEPFGSNRATDARVQAVFANLSD